MWVEKGEREAEGLQQEERPCALGQGPLPPCLPTSEPLSFLPARATPASWAVLAAWEHRRETPHPAGSLPRLCWAAAARPFPAAALPPRRPPHPRRHRLSPWTLEPQTSFSGASNELHMGSDTAAIPPVPPRPHSSASLDIPDCGAHSGCAGGGRAVGGVLGALVGGPGALPPGLSLQLDFFPAFPSPLPRGPAPARHTSPPARIRLIWAEVGSRQLRRASESQPSTLSPRLPGISSASL